MIKTVARAGGQTPFLESIVNEDQAAAINDSTIQKHNHYIRDITTIAQARGDAKLQISIHALYLKIYTTTTHTYLKHKKKNIYHLSITTVNFANRNKRQTST